MSERGTSAGRTLRPWATAFVLGMLLLSAERALLDLLFRPDALETAASVFVEGLRFDAAAVAYVLLPAWLASLLLPHLRHGAITVALGVLTLLCLVELHFFAEFRRRLDFVAFEYLDDPGTSLGMAVEHIGGFRVLVELATALALVAVMRRVLRRREDDEGAAQRGPWLAQIGVLALLVVAARGGLGRPLRPQDVTSGPAHFHRQLALSGPFTLARHGYEAWRDGGSLPDYGVPQGPEALACARSVFAAPDDRFLDEDVVAWRAVPPGDSTWRSVVVVVLESFAARHVGTLGAADSWTPELDRHAARGVTFTRFLANGPSTNRGLPALLAGLPSFPKRTALTKSIEGEQPFLTLGRVLGSAGARTAFLTAGAASWENLGGWCAGQGFETVIDGDDFEAGAELSVWGVADETLLDRTLVECDRMAAEGTFCAVALTSSNHPPFAVPEEFLPGVENPRERALLYADRALGSFLDAAFARPWARNTIFVLVGDHGLHDAARAEIDPERYHVPLVILDGSHDAREPLVAQRVDGIACQVDVLPTVIGLLGGGEHAAWGRDLFDENAPGGVAVLGPHGGAPFIAAADDAGRFVVVPLGRDAPITYRWDAAADTLEAAETDAQALTLAATARAYLATAHRVVLERRAAPPADE
jgi:hypothetical protein